MKYTQKKEETQQQQQQRVYLPCVVVSAGDAENGKDIKKDKNLKY